MTPENWPRHGARSREWNAAHRRQLDSVTLTDFLGVTAQPRLSCGVSAGGQAMRNSRFTAGASR